ncbi:MAG: prepilin-type N-terminal cleavage/methylation domain-containing protein [Planctomycetota bacterium]
MQNVPNPIRNSSLSGRRRRASRAFGSAGSRRARGFTLIELLVVISILTLVIGLSFPYLRGMIRSSAEQMAANSVANAVSAARSFAVRYKPFTDSPSYTNRTAESNGDGYSGAAVVVTPANELRLVENDELGIWAGSGPTGGRRMELPEGSDPIRNGFGPIVDSNGNLLVNDLLLPRRIAILGIQRTADDELQLLPPPFAIAFTRRGTLAVRDSFLNSSGLSLQEIARLKRQLRSDGAIYHSGSEDFVTVPFDANNDGDTNDPDDFRNVLGYRGTNRETFANSGFNTGGTLGTLRNLTDFARGAGPIIEQGPNAGRRLVPWDRLEPVVGVVIFNPDALPVDLVIPDDADPNSTNQADEGRYHPDRAREIVIDTSDDDNLLGWATQRGRGEVLFFNRNTGNNLNR